MAESNPLCVYEVTLRYEDLKLKVHCITKRSLQEELYLAFAVAFESLQSGSSSRTRKRSFFKRSPSHDQGEVIFLFFWGGSCVFFTNRHDI